jgi:branched-chain amino acid transport system permease protein
MSGTKRYGLLALVVAGIAAVAFPFVAGPYPQSIMRTVFVFMALALAWDILVRSGQLSFGIAGFFGLGAYASVIASSTWGVGGIASILLAGLVAGTIAFLLGLLILRLRAMYFAITTLALSEIFRIIIRNWRGFTGGPDGKILQSVIFDGNAYGSYYLTLGLVVVVILVSEAVERGPIPVCPDLDSQQ